METFFHEFGHILHQTLTEAEITRFAGSSTEGDFVEAPSQIMENWTWEPEILARFARHYESGEPIPAELVSQLTAAKNLNLSLLTLRQAQFGCSTCGCTMRIPHKDLDDIHLRSTESRPLSPPPGDLLPGLLWPPPRWLRRRVLRLLVV